MPPFKTLTLASVLILGAGTALADDVPFAAPQHIGAHNSIDAVVLGDGDGDGDLDVFTASDGGGGTGLYWENTAGDGSIWAAARTTVFSLSSFGDLAGGDMDGDGDLDIVAVESFSDSGLLAVNVAGDGSAWTSTGLTISVSGNGTGLDVGDIDGDGDLDLVGAGTGGLRFFRNTNGNGTSWSSINIVTSFTAASVVAADIDGDGDLDALASSSSANEVSWFENTAGDGSTWTERPVSTARTDVVNAKAGDMDGDGDLDVLFASPTDGLFAWAENTTGDGSAWKERTIDLGATTPADVHAADIDMDGDLDLLATDGGAFTVDWYENTAGDGSAWTQRSLESSVGEARAVTAGDLDGDGDLDVVATDAAGEVVVWWENLTLHRSAVFPFGLEVDGAFTAPEDFAVADLDGDGDPDVLAGADAEDLTWWQNTAGDGSTWTEQVIASLQGGRVVRVHDLDLDGDLDALVASATDDILWFENTAGDGSAWSVRIIDVTAGLALGVDAADIDGDGDIDVVATDSGDDVLWFENTSGDALSWSLQTVNADFGGALAIEAADIDGDGDTDVLATAETAGEVAWFENTAGDGSAWTEHTIDGSFGGADSVAAADIDGDGDIDVLGAASSLDLVTWFENTAGDGSAWTERTVDAAFLGAEAVAAADLDGDGDLDVLGAGTGDGLQWWQNTLGDGTAWSAEILDTPFAGATRVQAADVDGDGDLDLLGSSISEDAITWWGNLGGQFALPTSDAVVNPQPNVGDTDVLLLRIDAAHRGRTGDGDLELVTFELLFEESPGDPLSGAELDALISALRIYHDDGDGVFETDGSDFNFHTMAAPFTLSSGVLTTSFVDGEADVQVSFGAGETYFVAVDLPADAIVIIPSTLRVTHLTASSSSAEMSSTDLPLELEFAVDVASSFIDVATNLAPELDAPLKDTTWAVDALLNYDVSSFFSDPRGDILTFTAAGQPATISFLEAGIFSGTPAAGDFAGSPYTVTVRATDPEGLFVEDTFEVTIEPAPEATLAVGDTMTLPFSIDGAEALAMGDLDGDGDLDLLTLATVSADLLWWQNTAGDGSAWSPSTLDGALPGGQALELADVDRDGDLDVLAAAGDGVSWYENTLGDGGSWSKHFVSAAANGISDLGSCDVDGDGTPDVIAGDAAADRVYAWLNTGGDGSLWAGGDFGSADATAVDCGDVDGDGDLDIVAPSFSEDRLSYWINANATFSELSLPVALTGPEPLLIRDVDGDGDLDVLFGATGSGALAWRENADGDGSTWNERRISESSTSPTSLEMADLDLDGDLDVAAVHGGGLLSWWENLDGDAGSWIERPVVTTGLIAASDLILADVDGDGDTDFVLSDSSGDSVRWIENATLHRSALFPAESLVASGFNGFAVSLHAADLDSDGDLDLLGAEAFGEAVSWWRNDDGLGGAWTEISIATSFDGANSARAADVDGDGDLDVVACASSDRDVAWWENISGDGTTWTQRSIDTFTGAQSVEPADLDGDGDVDVVGASRLSDSVVWWENTAGDGTAWTKQTIDAFALDVIATFPVDVDGDGDLDVTAAGDDFFWYENVDGTATTWVESTVTTIGLTFALNAADLDGDGDTDLLSSNALGTIRVAWWQNASGDGSAWTEKVLDADFGARSISAADLDGDGDFDIFSSSDEDTVAWWENVAGDGSTWIQHTVSLAVDEPRYATTGDFDGDGDVDLAVGARAGDTLTWWANRGGQFALPTSDAVIQPRPAPGSDDVPLLRIDATHRGRDGDGDLELVTFELLFEESAAEPLSGAELDSIVSALHIVHDDGDGVFEPDGSDTEFHTLTAPFTLSSGVLTATFSDGAPDVRVSFGADETYFVVVDLQADADLSAVDSLIVTHLTSSSSTAETAETDIPLALEPDDDVSSTTLIGFDNRPPAVQSPIANTIWFVDAQLSLSLASSFTEPNGEGMTFSASGLPSSLSLSSSGVLTGLPTEADVPGSPYQVTIRATDTIGLFVEDTFTAHVITQPSDTVAVGGAQTIVPFQDGADDLVFGDIDRDGALDVVMAARKSADITWWRNAAADGSSWSRTTIDGAFLGADSVAVGDLDGDGSLDVLASARDAGTLAWFENTADDGSAWTERTIDAGFDGPVDAEPGDIDGDGDLDVVAGAMDGDELAWFENTAGDASAWSKHTVDAAFDVSSVNCRDLDGDDDLDLLAADFSGDLVSWFENIAGDGSTWTEHPLTVAFTGPKDVLARDVDGDGDQDALLAASGAVAWIENLDGSGSSWRANLISEAQTSPMAIRAADVDQDGDLDVVSADGDGRSVSWWQNLGDAIAWLERPVVDVAGATSAVAAQDVDGDGDIDFAVADSSGDSVDWFENETLHRSAFFPDDGRLLIEDAFTGVYDIEAVDMDGDGDLDALTAAPGSNDVVWWQNDGDGSSWTKQTIEVFLNDVIRATAADLDGDGDLDAVAAGFGASTIRAWLNLDGVGTSWSRLDLLTGFGGAHDVHTADLDGDGDLDVLAAAETGDEVAWLENGGDGLSWTRRTLDASFLGARSATAADLDRDGDLDVVAAAGGADTVAWWENVAGDGTSWTKRTVDGGFGGAHGVATADIDGDGDLDIVGTAETDGQVSWWENTAGDGAAWAEHVVTAAFLGAGSIAAKDLDGDGDLDLLGTARDADTVSWFENRSGDGTAWTEHVLTTTFTGTTSAAAGDIDGDGAPDLLATSFDLDDIAWWQNLGGQFALPTADAVAGPTPREGSADVLLLHIDAAHRGRTGDGDLELSTLELLFEEAAGDSLTNGELAALVDTVRLYQDDGDGIFETDGSDAEIYSAGAPFGLASGVLTVAFADGAAEARVAFGDDETYFVAVDLAAAAATAVPNTLRLTHLASSSTAQMASTGLPLALEYLADTSAATITAVGNPEITVSPPSLDFGVQLLSGGATAAQEVVVTNDGVGALTLHSVALVGADAAAFSITADTGEATLAPGESRTVDIAFDPTDLGMKSASLRILSDDADESTIDVALAGVGVEPEITVSPLSMSFDAIDVGDEGAPQSVTITNDGSTTLTLTAAVLTGDGAAHFQVTDDSGEATLEPGEARSLDIAFAPTESGAFVAGLSLSSNDADEATVDVVLSGDSADWIFGDGFESGDFTAWSATLQ